MRYEHNVLTGETVELPDLPPIPDIIYSLPLQEAQNVMLSRVSAKRWQAETGGAAFGGTMIRTDATSQAKITGAVALFQNVPDMQPIDFEAQPGVWVTLDQVAMTAVGIAVGQHVQACYSRSKVLCEAINAAEDVPALAAIEIELGWPT